MKERKKERKDLSVMGTAGSRKGIAEARTKVVPCNALHGEDYYIEFAERNTSEIMMISFLAVCSGPHFKFATDLDPDCPQKCLPKSRTKRLPTG